MWSFGTHPVREPQGEREEIEMIGFIVRAEVLEACRRAALRGGRCLRLRRKGTVSNVSRDTRVSRRVCPQAAGYLPDSTVPRGLRQSGCLGQRSARGEDRCPGRLAKAPSNVVRCAIVDLHLRIDVDLAGTIEIDLHADTDTASTAAHLDCRRLCYEEIGGEGFDARRHRSRQTLTQETLDALQRLLPSGRLATPSNALCGLDGTTVTLAIGCGANAVEYSWRSRPPAEWECLGEIVRLLVSIAGVAAYVDVGLDPPPGHSYIA